ncbi:MAG: hypothetical protein GXY34_00810 [Syntrophomonadaceae bacterium]|nr:hypothetical protein [Syntrophomonadaceae bacterium]
MIFIESYGTAMRTAEIQGGVDQVVVDAVRAHLQTLPNSIDVDQVNVAGTAPEVQYGGPIQVEMTYTYRYRILNNVMQALEKEVVFHPIGFTTSSKIVR